MRDLMDHRVPDQFGEIVAGARTCLEGTPEQGDAVGQQRWMQVPLRARDTLVESQQDLVPAADRVRRGHVGDRDLDVLEVGEEPTGQRRDRIIDEA